MTILTTKSNNCDEKVVIPIIPTTRQDEQILIPGSEPPPRRLRHTILHSIVAIFLVCLLYILVTCYMRTSQQFNVERSQLQRIRCHFSEDGIPHFEKIGSEDLEDNNNYFPFNVRIFRIWLPQLFDQNNTSDQIAIKSLDGEEDSDELDDGIMQLPFNLADDIKVNEGAASIPDFNIDNNIFKEEFAYRPQDVEQVLTIDILDFKNGKRNRFVHAFKKNQTAIVDKEAKRCFVMPLDADRVVIPDDILSMSSDKDLNTERIRKNMEIVTPKLEDLSELSPRIQLECEGMSVYKLDSYNSDLFKRDLTKSEKYSEFAGKGIVEFNIVNWEAVDNLEKSSKL